MLRRILLVSACLAGAALPFLVLTGAAAPPPATDPRQELAALLDEYWDLALRNDLTTVIGSGSMPLTVLEKHIDWWIGEEKKR